MKNLWSVAELARECAIDDNTTLGLAMKAFRILEAPESVTWKLERLTWPNQLNLMCFKGYDTRNGFTKLFAQVVGSFLLLHPDEAETILSWINTETEERERLNSNLVSPEFANGCVLGVLWAPCMIDRASGGWDKNNQLILPALNFLGEFLEFQFSGLAGRNRDVNGLISDLVARFVGKRGDGSRSVHICTFLSGAYKNLETVSDFRFFGELGRVVVREFTHKSFNRLPCSDFQTQALLEFWRKHGT